ncbi:hypothetical protein A6R68_05934 [Neotoma lepida]|uniref:Uncharacterized protein n=1 Tax=Neotoma lepida TaxID=56216 RepID=A0A1A6GH25_NEOLE|nr:hypothetical protein A6R68_05934 [Neotoma lepida]
MKHLWLKDSEELLKLSSSLEMLSSKPNLNIVTAINIHHQIKPVKSSVATTPSCFPMVHLPLNSTGSEPALPTYTFLAKHSFHDNDKIIMKKGSRRLSMPDILWCQQNRNLFPKVAPECDPVAAHLMRSSFQERYMTSKAMALGSTSSENNFSRNKIAQMAPQSEANLKNSSSPQSTSSVISSRKATQGVTTISTCHKERSSFLCETSEPSSTSTQPQAALEEGEEESSELFPKIVLLPISPKEKPCFPEESGSNRKGENGVT